MSVIHKKSNGGASTEIEKEVREVKAAGEQTAALLALSFKAQIVQDRAAGTNVISDAAILQSAEVIEYDEYADNHAYNTVGEIIKHNGRYYEIKAAHTSNAAAYPVETTFAYYRLIELSATGTLDDPIPYPETAGIVVNVVSGLYYSYKGAVYLAKADMPNCVYPPDTAGLWQWEKRGIPCKSRYAELRLSAGHGGLVAMGKSNLTGRRINDGHFHNGSFRLFYRMRYRVRLYRFCS